jgi:hypothetical protein
VCPARDTGVALVLPRLDTAMMTLFPGSSPGQACMGIFIVKRDHGGDLFFFASALGADALGSQRA